MKDLLPRNPLLLLCSATLGLLLPGLSLGQVVLSGSTPSYNQNFNGLPGPSTGEALAWTNNVTLTGWLRELQASTGAIDNSRNWSGDGVYQASSVPALFNYGTFGSSDRALGMRVAVFEGSSQGGSIGIVFHNQTGLYIDSLTVSYVGEQWRRSGSTVTNQLLFGYQSVANFSLVGDNPYNLALATGFTLVPALHFVSPNFSGGGTTLDGNLTANRTARSSTITLGTALAPGEFLVLRWRYDPPTASGHGLAIDDLNISFTTTAIPEPGLVGAVFGLAALGGVIRSRRRRA